MNLETLLTIAVFGPLFGAAAAGLFGRRLGNVLSQSITTGLLFLSCAIAWFAFAQHTWAGQENFVVELLPFIQIGDFSSTWSIRFDALSATMLIVVTTVSALVHLYSWGYMAEDPGKPRFFAYLSLFTFAMLALVTANDFMQLFFGWEGVGLASYLLIGFWFHKATANSAAIKAFVVNRVGDFGFALGIFTVYAMFGTIRFDELFPLIPTMAGKSWSFIGYEWSALNLAGFLLFVGACGKSAQFFLHTWLPDAMEGPTPVSALIHAATMVTAGVYMVCLLSPLYEHALIARDIICITGAITSLFAATVGLAQNDIKRVIAYSTCSQLGYMFFAAGVGAYDAAMFHLFTHAAFKALLFLGAGSVIMGMHHEQDMRGMGGLRKYMPLTFGAMTIGTIAITGLGWPGVGGFAGFYSKDAIIEAAYEAGKHNDAGVFAFWIGVIVAGLTAYYSWRLAFMTFEGSKKWADGHHGDAHHADDHHHHGVDADHPPKESPATILVPLAVLSAAAISAGFVFAPYFLGEHAAGFWGGAIYGIGGEGAHAAVEHHEHPPQWVIFAPLVVSVLGLIAAAWFYLVKQGLAKRMADNGGPLHSFFYNKWYFDELYDFVFVKGAKAIGDVFKWADKNLIDRLGPDGFAWTSLFSAGRLSKVQSGYVYHYAFVMLLGVAGLLTFAFWLMG